MEKVSFAQARDDQAAALRQARLAVERSLAALDMPAGRYFVEVTGAFPEPEDGELDATLRVELL